MPANFEEGQSAHEIVRTTSNKPAKRQPGSKQTKAQSENALTEFVRQVDEEMAGFAGDATGAVNAFVDHKADEVVQAIAGAPDRFYGQVEKGLRSLEVDREGFRGTGESIKQRLFANFGIVEKAA